MTQPSIDLEYFRRRLLEEQDRLEKQEAGLNAGGLNQSAQESIQELSMYDNHPADIATETLERSKDVTNAALLETRRRKITEALARIDQGSYGRCSQCGQLISPQRLDAVPETPFCLECQRIAEANTRPRAMREITPEKILASDDPWRWPSPEDVLGGDIDPARFDPIDSWQAVANYGTSSEPGWDKENEGEDDEEE